MHGCLAGIQFDMKSIDIYLDIDGVLVGTQSPKEDVVELLHWIMINNPDNTYWLTTHCQRGSNRCSEYLKRNHFPEHIVETASCLIKPTDWDVLKTEAIDFTKEFVWLEDDPLQIEIEVLKEKAALNRLLIMDKHNPQMAKLALKQLIALSEKLDRQASNLN